MNKYICIGAGGFIGAILRFHIKELNIYYFNGNIPLHTLLVNVAGCFFIGMFLTLALEVLEMDTNFSLGISTGLLGALTTFSALCKETYTLILQGKYYSAITYVTVSTILGIAAVYFGVVLVREVISKYADKEEEDNPEDEIAV